MEQLKQYVILKEERLKDLDPSLSLRMTGTFIVMRVTNGNSEYSEESYLPKFWSRAGLDSSLRSEWQHLVS
ncbi:hypothetical protein [Desulfosporosinus sp.]|uniref:hypothetical protein n=1 Tax=Desulfosporosinus sp. TaxID=157907 RepID=UPI0025BFA375|nr:hypothetical protein [Desulfosporosinus sp.]MBC2723919.1 hypothetical protein [Desulfosporosinus sp.]